MTGALFLSACLQLVLHSRSGNTQQKCTCVYLKLLQPAFYTQFALKSPSQQCKVHSAACALSNCAVSTIMNIFSYFCRSVPLPKDVDHFKRERKLAISKSLQVCSILKYFTGGRGSSICESHTSVL